MAKTQNKTTETSSSVTDFINLVDDEQKRKDSLTIIKLLKKISGKQPKMWGPSIIGFDSYHYKYDSGHEGDAPLLGFSPRKAAISLYIYAATEQNKKLLEKLGKYKMGKSCIYIKKLADLDEAVFNKIAQNTLEHYKKKYPAK